MKWRRPPTIPDLTELLNIFWILSTALSYMSAFERLLCNKFVTVIDGRSAFGRVSNRSYRKTNGIIGCKNSTVVVSSFDNVTKIQCHWHILVWVSKFCSILVLSLSHCKYPRTLEYCCHVANEIYDPLLWLTAFFLS